MTAQETPAQKREPGHKDNNKFSQMYDLLATPNMFRTASGAPGPAYYQQQADYKMDIELDDKNTKLLGKETITYHNNSPENLEYLWIQLDQNINVKDSKSKLRLYLTGQNLAVFTNYSGVDPEVNYSGLDNPGIDRFNNYPRPRTITFGLNFTLAN